MLRESNNDAILAFTRSCPEETLLCIMNLANTPRAGRIELPDYAGWMATDVFGGAGFPAVGAAGGYDVTLGSRNFFWLKLDAPGQAEPGPVEGARAAESGEQVDFAALSRPAPPAAAAPAQKPTAANTADHEEGSAA